MTGPLCLIKIIVALSNSFLAADFSLKGSDSELSTSKPCRG